MDAGEAHRNSGKQKLESLFIQDSNLATPNIRGFRVYGLGSKAVRF